METIMRKLILTALMVATVMPVAAEAQNRRDDRRSDRRDDRRDERTRRWGDNDWRDWRGQNRGVYSRGTWRAPFRYYAFRPGIRIQPNYYGSSYWINDPWRYRLPPAGYGQRWVRHYDDVLLIDTRRGVVIRVLNNFYW
jgi:Ni/Co efflux regulator RcnB